MSDALHCTFESTLTLTKGLSRQTLTGGELCLAGHCDCERTCVSTIAIHTKLHNERYSKCFKYIHFVLASNVHSAYVFYSFTFILFSSVEHA